MILIHGLTHVVPGTASIAFRAYQSKKWIQPEIARVFRGLFVFLLLPRYKRFVFLHAACNSKITGVSSQEIAAFVSTRQVLEQIF